MKEEEATVEIKNKISNCNAARTIGDPIQLIKPETGDLCLIKSKASQRGCIQNNDDNLWKAKKSSKMEHSEVFSSDSDAHSIGAFSGADVGFEGFPSSNYSPPHSPKRDLMQHIEETNKITVHYPQREKYGTVNKDMEVEIKSPMQQQQQDRSSLKSGWGSISIEDDVELRSAIPAKRRKHIINEHETFGEFNGNLAPLIGFVNAPNLQTPPDHIEVNSHSTAKSEMCGPIKRSSKYHLRCSTETTSDFPVSSPSNPQAMDGQKFQRPAFLKNTLPANAFERNLALLTAQKPQMTLEEKINAWQCDLELSDVEDVNNFDALFKEHEELKRRVFYTAKSMDKKGSVIENQYDFKEFRAKVIRNFRAAALLPRNTDAHLLIDKPSTSFSSQRRLRTATENENKKRLHIERPKGKKSTTTTVTSSSENEALYSSGTKQKPKKYIPVQKLSLQKGHSNEKMLRRDDLAKKTHRNFDLNFSIVRSSSETLANNRFFTKVMQQKPPTPISNQFPTDEDSAFNMRCVDCESGRVNKNPQCFIQMRQDFSSEKKTLHLQEKKSELFKTPTVPQKYTHVSTSRTLDNNKESVVRSKENFEFVNMSSPSSPEALESDEPVSPTATAAFHQQHEFCNYLGLTGMSTANAVANAVAELAKCNLARRSLRVRRLQQQEKKDKEQQINKQPVNEESRVQFVKPVGDFTPEQKHKSDKSNEIDIQSRSSLFEPNLLASNNLAESISKGPAESLTDGKIFFTKPEIKIICHISADADKVKTEKESNHANEVVAPVQETTIRHLNPDAASSNYTSTCPRSSISEFGAIEDSRSTRTPKQKITPREHMNCSSSKEIKYYSNVNNSSFATPKKSILLPKKLEESAIVKQKLHNKFQKFLEASRKMKPSIYIVQTLNSSDDHKQHIRRQEEKIVSESKMKQPTIFCIQQHHSSCHQPERKSRLSGGEKCSLSKGLTTKRKKKERLRKIFTQSAWHKRHQRPLRKRKILLVRTIKREAETNRSTEKIDKSVATEFEPSLAALSETSVRPIQNIKSFNIISNEDQIKNEREGDHHTLCKKVEERNDNSENRHMVKRAVQSKRAHLIINDREKAKQRNKKATERSTPSPADTSSESKDVKIPLKTIAQMLSNNNVPVTKCHVMPNNDNETVVVSSTTNSYDEATLLKLNNNQVPHEQKTIPSNTSYVILTKEHSQQNAATCNGIHYLNSPAKSLSSPIKSENGRVDYIYYEMDVLIVVQERSISFWKYFKLINVLSAPQYNCQLSHKNVTNKLYPLQLEPSSSTTTVAGDSTTVTVAKSEWVSLGECRRLINDIEIPASYANRICTHNSIPIYMEMRCRIVPRERRECNLLSMYVNVYYYNDDEMLAKMHSIQLDAVQSTPSEVVYTTLTESRYFVMTWHQENILGKTRTGLCKYSLTPNMDTLASIREFKNMRHSIRYLECSSDDRLIGFGDTQLTIWNHRSGDVLMNYDLDMELGRNLGSIYYPSLEIGQNSMLLLFQYMRNSEKGVETAPELLIIACSISHTNPSHRILRRYNLPYPAFCFLNNATNTGDHLVITAQNDEEIWISCADANTITHVPAQGSRRFYSRSRTQLIELTNETLTVDSFANHVLKLAASTDIKLNVNNSGVYNSV